MKFTLAASALALASTVSAACLTKGQATTLVNEYAALQAHVASDLGGPRKTGRAILAADFQETSDSLNELIGLPLGTVTFPNKKGYINAVIGTDAAFLDTIKLFVSGCRYISWYWIEQTTGPDPVRGFHLFEVNDDLDISEAWTEFNSIAWNENLGGSCTIPSAQAAQSVVV